MSALQWERRPNLRKPVLIASFAGWNDAGDAATTATGYLCAQWAATPFASIDPEDFFDFTVTRPTFGLDEDGHRSIDWPTNRFLGASVPGAGVDVAFLQGVEPQLKWRTFTEAVMECAMEIDAGLVLTLGSLLADVPHTRPAHVTGTTSDRALIDAMGLERSQYEGPTGIVGVLHNACTAAGIRSASLWAAVPHYVSQTPSPKATLALVKRATEILGVAVSTVDLEIASAAYESQVSEVVREDDDMVAYVAELEAHGDDDEIDPVALAAEAEKYLRNQRD